MAKRKAARGTKRKTTGGRAAARTKSRGKKGLRKSARKAVARKSRKAARPAARKGSRKAAARKSAARKAPARTAKARKTTARKATARKSAARKSQARKAPARKAPRSTTPARKPPALDRERRTVREDYVAAGPPSSLDLDRSASSARSGRRELREKYDEHTETSPAITGGDVDADWESAYSVGDEAPGGDNPTPDQDIVDDIGRAMGVEYEDNEELKGEKKISDRDRKRWEYDPASSEDYEER